MGAVWVLIEYLAKYQASFCRFPWTSCHFSLFRSTVRDAVLRANRYATRPEISSNEAFLSNGPRHGDQSCQFVFSRCIKNELKAGQFEEIVFHLCECVRSRSVLPFFSALRPIVLHVFLFGVFALSLSCLLFSLCVAAVLFSFTIASVRNLSWLDLGVASRIFSVYRSFQSRYTTIDFGRYRIRSNSMEKKELKTPNKNENACITSSVTSLGAHWKHNKLDRVPSNANNIQSASDLMDSN